MYQWNRSFNVPAPPGSPSGIWIFGNFLFKFPSYRAEKLLKCPQPRENYQITVLTFSSFYYGSQAVHVNMVH